MGFFFHNEKHQCYIDTNQKLFYSMMQCNDDLMMQLIILIKIYENFVLKLFIFGVTANFIHD